MYTDLKKKKKSLIKRTYSVFSPPCLKKKNIAISLYILISCQFKGNQAVNVSFLIKKSFYLFISWQFHFLNSRRRNKATLMRAWALHVSSCCNVRERVLCMIKRSSFSFFFKLIMSCICWRKRKTQSSTHAVIGPKKKSSSTLFSVKARPSFCTCLNYSEGPQSVQEGQITRRRTAFDKESVSRIRNAAMFYSLYM